MERFYGYFNANIIFLNIIILDSVIVIWNDSISEVELKFKRIWLIVKIILIVKWVIVFTLLQPFGIIIAIPHGIEELSLTGIFVCLTLLIQELISFYLLFIISGIFIYKKLENEKYKILKKKVKF